MEENQITEMKKKFRPKFPNGYKKRKKSKKQYLTTHSEVSDVPKIQPEISKEEAINQAFSDSSEIVCEEEMAKE